MRDKNTKIVCTIGPASWDPAVMEKLILSGMNIARLNMSHGSHEEKVIQIKTLRDIAKKLNRPLAIVGDLQGPKIRLGKIGGVIKEGERDPKKFLQKGDIVSFSSETEGEDQLPMQFDLSPFMKKGERILLNDGLIEVVVQDIKGKVITGEVKNDGYISSNKGVNVPDTKMPGASLTPKDYADADFILSQNGEYLAISFVQSVDDIAKAREIIKKHNSKAKIIVKLEKPQALEDLEEIIKATDAVMVARGDLAIETQAATVPLVQKRIIRLARQYFKPVIVATQMLESMTENPRPTRAEVSDVANAVFDQADAVMLSGESANGKYPVETVSTMNEIIETVESEEEYRNYVGIDGEEIDTEELASRSIAASAAFLSEMCEAKLIIVATATGHTAQSLSSFRPEAEIIAVTHDEFTKNQLALLWGVTAVVVEPAELDAFWDKTLEIAKKQEFVTSGDRVVIISGPTIGIAGHTDTIKVVKV